MATAFVDEWAHSGVAVAAVAPGSRSTPMALALAGDSRIRVEVFLDERSASFFALGVAKASGRPAVVLCTSGTAAAEFHAAVVEANHARVPLLVVTADRPAELRDTGAPQTIDQSKLYGGAVRWFVDVPAPETTARPGYWRSAARRAVGQALGPPAGPVHLNLAFREPLVPATAPARSGGAESRAADAVRPWMVSTRSRFRPDAQQITALTSWVRERRRGVVVAGWGADVDPAVVERFSLVAGWPLLADPLSGLRQGTSAISTYDPVLRDASWAERLRPESALGLGAPPTGSVTTGWLDQRVDRLVFDPDGLWLDPNRSAAGHLRAEPEALLEAVTDLLVKEGLPTAPSAWMERWMAAEATARAVLDSQLDADDTPFEGRVARDVVAGLPAGATLVVGSSMPVRDVESFAAPRTGLRFLANRGANGIDGFVSTVLGVAAADPGPVVALTGDLTFLHDVGGLLRVADRRLSATFVVLDNDGGGIFSFLAQAGSDAFNHDRFETLFGTPHGLDLVAVAAAYGVPAQRVISAAALMPALEDAIAAGGVRLLIVPTDRAENVNRHRRLWSEVSSALRSACPGGCA